MTTINIHGSSNDTNLVLASENASIREQGDISYITVTEMVTEISYVNVELTSTQRLDNYLNNITDSDSLGVVQIDDLSGSVNNYSLTNVYSYMKNNQSLETMTWTASTIKTYLSMLYGVAIKQGKMSYSDLNDSLKPVSYYLPELSGTILDVATLDDLLSGSSGLPDDDFLLDNAPESYNLYLQTLNEIGGSFPPCRLAGILAPTNDLSFASQLINIKNLFLLNISGEPVYTNRTDGLTKSTNSNVYVPGSGRPSDIASCYSSAAISLAGIILQKIVCESDGIIWNSPQGLVHFNNWRNNNLDSKLGYSDQSFNLTITSFENTFIFGGGVGYTTNNFIKNIALLIINNGFVNGEQILDPSFINDINSNSIQKYRRFKKDQYYFRGVWLSMDWNYNTNTSKKTPVNYMSGLGGIRISWANNKLVSVFRRSSAGLDKNNYNIKSNFVYPFVNSVTILTMFGLLGRYGAITVLPDGQGGFLTLDTIAGWEFFWENLVTEFTAGGNYTLEETKLLQMYPYVSKPLYGLDSQQDSLKRIEENSGFDLINVLVPNVFL